ncbi:prefoldin beta subunit [Fusarium oxysporum f. sp. raphani 54005]|uniref:Prefoldin beta subunit n=1 Tax=Fusarium oxysporum f. sp. raphani 54005 TaxID=1089458 RepID=X0CR59_FUSOX|nr:prefoldin beta subunit [Fusarium oxysporum f. sp. raphani 54005]
MSDPQARLQALSEDFQKLQGVELQNAVASRQKLEGQKQENVGVQQEFERLQEGETIYKLAGPVLLKQDKFEAENTVKGRLDFISGEITRLEDTIKETQEKLEKKKTEIIQIQTAAQSQGKEAPQ